MQLFITIINYISYIICNYSEYFFYFIIWYLLKVDISKYISSKILLLKIWQPMTSPYEASLKFWSIWIQSAWVRLEDGRRKRSIWMTYFLFLKQKKKSRSFIIRVFFYFQFIDVGLRYSLHSYKYNFLKYIFDKLKLISA